MNVFAVFKFPVRERLTAGPALFAALAGVIGVACLAFGERVEVNEGLGWDGVIYARWVRDFHQEIFVNKVDTYYVQRILPAAVVHYGLRACWAPLNDANIMRAFGLLSVALLGAMGGLWGAIGRELKISQRGQWLGFLALFCNYVVLKHSFYVPVTTDVCAYAIGLAMLYCYLTDRRIGLIALTLAGAFTWPLAVYVGIALLLFPRSESAAGNVNDKRPIILIAIGSVFSFFAIHYEAVLGPQGQAWLGDAQYFDPVRSLVNLSSAVSAIYLFLGAAVLCSSSRLLDWRTYITPARLGWTALTLIALASVRQWQHAWSNGVQFMGVRDMLENTALTTAAKPGVFLVTHAAYYGPFFLLALFLWRPVSNLIRSNGVGLSLAVGMGLVLTLNSQSRYVINIFVMVIPFVAKATDTLRWRAPQIGLLAGLSLLASKVWLTTNVAPFTGKLLEFPDQLLFMTHGPWISTEMYLLQGAVMMGSGYAIWRVCLQSKPAAIIQVEPRQARVAA
ncbi:MAG: hypothetical protein ACJ8C4_02045 [Gemmataceae bacterium]